MVIDDVIALPYGSGGQMIEGETGERWTATGVSAQFIRGCKHPRMIVMIAVSDSSQTP